MGLVLKTYLSGLVNKKNMYFSRSQQSKARRYNLHGLVKRTQENEWVILPLKGFKSFRSVQYKGNVLRCSCQYSKLGFLCSHVLAVALCEVEYGCEG